MTHPNSASETYLVRGNESFLLQDSQTVHIIKSGSVALFATALDQGEPIGNRSYLFTLKSGEGLFGLVYPYNLETENQLGILAVPLEETELQPCNLEKLISPQNSDASLNIALLEGWLHNLSQGIAQKLFSDQMPVNVIPAENGHYLSLLKEQNLVAPKQELVWVKVNQGQTYYLGREELIVDLNSPIFPLVSPLWLEAQSSVELSLSSTDALENSEEIINGLEQFHHYFFRYFEASQKRQLEIDFQQFQERVKLNIQASQNSVDQLTNLINPKKDGFFGQGNNLLVAAGAVGHALGIKVIPPMQSETLHRTKEPLDVIARSSQFRIRRVLLEGKWWKKDNGPLFAYLKENRQPVALLPDKNNQYFLFDPELRRRILVNEKVAETLALDAYMFYRPFPTLITNGFQIFRFGTKGYEKDIVGILAITLISTLMGMITPQATALLVNNAIPDSNHGLLLQIGLALLAMAFGKLIFQIAQSILSLRVETGAGIVLQSGMWDRILKLNPQFFRQYSTGDLLPRVTAISQIRNLINGAIQRTLLSGLFSVFNLGLMFYYNFTLSIVGIVITVVIMIMTIVSASLLIPKERRQEELGGELTALNVELINGVAKLRVAVAEKRAFAAWVKKYSENLKLTLEIQQINDILTIFNQAISLISNVVIYFLVGSLIFKSAQTGDSSLTLGTYLAFNTAYGTFQGGATSISNTFTDILEFIPLWERAQVILEAEPESNLDKADPGILRGNLFLDHIVFSYKEDGLLVLDDVSLYAESGEFIALVGPSGSGKSTIMRLMLGFESPHTGSVYYDGQDLSGVEPVALRRQLGVVLQNVKVPAASIFEIIASGSLITLDEAWEAARMAGFDRDIEQMPMGMHTVISEGGSNLSGGQRQRLMIARALVMKPKIILLDEATSALDNQTQLIVTESLAHLSATRIVIAHRLSTIRDADRIYVMEAGRVVQVGTFDELLAVEGLFARLAARQLD